MAVCPKKAPTLLGSQWPNRPRATNYYGKGAGSKQEAILPATAAVAAVAAA